MDKHIPNPNVSMRLEEDGKYLAFDSKTGAFTILNSTSHFIWMKTADGLTDEEIAKEILNEYAFADSAPTVDEMLRTVASHIAAFHRSKLLLGEEQRRMDESRNGDQL